MPRATRAPPGPAPTPTRTHEDTRQLVQHPVLRRSHTLQVLLGTASLQDGTRYGPLPDSATPAALRQPPELPPPPRPVHRAPSHVPRRGGGGGSPRRAVDGNGWRQRAAAKRPHHGCAPPEKTYHFRSAANMHERSSSTAVRPLPARRSSAARCQGRWGAWSPRAGPPRRSPRCPADELPTGGEAGSQVAPPVMWSFLRPFSAASSLDGGSPLRAAGGCVCARGARGEGC